MRILVVGGAGYIGSHMVKLLLNRGYQPVTLDNLSTGYRDAILGGEFVHASLADIDVLAAVFRKHQFDAVMHFASFIHVGESVRNPVKYYRNNYANTLNLLEAMVAADVRRFIFSSTAAIFGDPETATINESHPKSPVNPYGRTKLMVEETLNDYDQAYGLKSICLRYFNAAGADPAGFLGERHEPETHLIPLALQVASGRKPYLEVYGDDYPTPDGTCIRDYVHVLDLCEAHLLGLDHLVKTGKSDAFNLGNGDGFSVAAVIQVARQVTSHFIPTRVASRRHGDPARLVANSGRAKEILGWNPRFHDLSTIITHAWEWEKKYPYLDKPQRVAPSS